MRSFLILLLGIALYADVRIAIIEVSGMTCPLCTTAIKKSLKKTKGVIKAKVKLHTKQATVTYDDKKVKTDDLLEAIKKVGYSGILIRDTK